MFMDTALGLPRAQYGGDEVVGGDVDVLPASEQAARQGRVLSGMLEPDGLYLATAGKVPVALMDLKGGTAKVVRGFNLPDTAE